MPARMTAATAACESRSVFVACVMTGVSYMALAVPRLIPVEVVERLFAAFRHRSCITMMRIVTVIDVTIEATATVKPRASSNENPAREPVRAVIAIRCARVWIVVEVPVWAHRRNSDVDGDLSGSSWAGGNENTGRQNE